MMGFFTSFVNAELARLRADRARLHTENCTLRAERHQLLTDGQRLVADNRFLRDENAALHASLAAAVENNRKLWVAFRKVVGHPSVRAATAKTAGWN